jgi:hypothetical protein
MKRIVLILLVIFLSSCSYDMMHTQYEYMSISSNSLFVIGGKAYTSYGGNLPITIYNPNNYAITVTADGTDYIIAPLGTLELKEDKAK